MKTLFIILLASLASPSFSQWNGIYFHGDTESVIAVLNKDTVFAATDWDGRIHRSTDAGQTWSFYQTPFTTSWFLDIHFPTDQVGYACGGTAFGFHKEIIAKTTDSGQTWDSLTSNAFGGYNFTRIRFINADTGYVAQETGNLLRTYDGGVTLTQLQPIDPQMLSVTEIALKPNKEIFVVLRLTQGPGSTSYAISRSSDLGLSWTNVYSDAKRINKINFVDDTTGYAVGEDGKLLKTTDGGGSWTSSLISPFTNLTSLHFTSQNVGYINNSGGIYRTDDGGTNWTVQNVNPLSIIQQIEFADDTIGYALGTDGIFKTTNAGIILGMNDHEESPTVSIFPNPTSDILFLSTTHEKPFKAVIINQLGQKVMDIEVTAGIDVTPLPKGVYFLLISTDECQTVKQFVKD